MKKKISKKQDKEMIQGVVLTFDDGQVAIFTGKAVCFEGETKKVRNISFTPPKNMPEGCSWEKIQETVV
jgi:hypothetical protein